MLSVLPSTWKPVISSDFASKLIAANDSPTPNRYIRSSHPAAMQQITKYSILFTNVLTLRRRQLHCIGCMPVKCLPTSTPDNVYFSLRSFKEQNQTFSVQATV